MPASEATEVVTTETEQTRTRGVKKGFGRWVRLQVAAGVPLALAPAPAPGAWTWPAAAGAAYLATAAMLARDQRNVAALPAWSALVFPLPALAFVAISTVAAIDHARGAPVRWRGRTVAVHR